MYNICIIYNIYKILFQPVPFINTTKNNRWKVKIFELLIYFYPVKDEM